MTTFEKFKKQGLEDTYDYFDTKNLRNRSYRKTSK